MLHGEVTEVGQEGKARLQSLGTIKSPALGLPGSPMAKTTISLQGMQVQLWSGN